MTRLCEDESTHPSSLHLLGGQQRTEVAEDVFGEYHLYVPSTELDEYDGIVATLCARHTCSKLPSELDYLLARAHARVEPEC